MTKKQKKQKKQIDRRVELAYYATCTGVQISILDIPKVFAAGRKAVAEGVDEDGLKTAIIEFVETIRKN